MNGFEDRFRLFSSCDIEEMPGSCQGNCEEINPELREFIFGGEPAEFNEDRRAALEKLIRYSRLKGIIVIGGLTVALLTIPIKLIQSRAEPSWWIFAILFAVMIFLIIAIYDQYANNIAIKEADKGNVFCFKYECYGKLRYVIDHEDSTCLYYANLGDFTVHISGSAELGLFVYGVVINIKGTEHFYLLV